MQSIALATTPPHNHNRSDRQTNNRPDTATTRYPNPVAGFMLPCDRTAPTVPTVPIAPTIPTLPATHQVFKNVLAAR